MNRDEYLNLVLNEGMVRTLSTKKEQTACAVKYPQGYFKEKKCKHCGNYFIPKAPSEHYCTDRCKRYRYIERYYKRTYNLSLKDYLDLAEAQNFKCKVCGKENFRMGEYHSGVLVVDHSHKTKRVRGLLCHNCNRALGLLQDNPDNIYNLFKYLQSVTTIPKGSTLQADGSGSGEHR